MKINKTNSLTLSGAFLALGIILPFFIGQIPEIGSALLPMHIPVFLCAFICGPKYAVPMSFVLPLIRTFLFGRPVFYPTAIAVAFELATYALVAGALYTRFKNKNLGSIYAGLLTAMIAGRAVRLGVQMMLLFFRATPFAANVIFAEIILAGIPGIIIQLIIIPITMLAVQRSAAGNRYIKK